MGLNRGRARGYRPRDVEGGEIMITIQTKARCVECSRVFNLLDEDDAGEWYYGHDCEV